MAPRRAKAKKSARGRPRIHDGADRVRAVCGVISSGTLVKDACAQHGVTAGQIRAWAAASPELSALYARAREDQAHALAEQAISIATGDDPITEAREHAIELAEDDLIRSGDKHWRKRIAVLETNLIARDRLRIDALKWMASKIAPRSYGDKVDLTTDGEKLPQASLLVVPAEILAVSQ